MNVLITGITGFVGSYITAFYLKKGYTIFGTKIPNSNTDKIANVKDQIELIDCDIKNANSIENVIKKSTPDIIHHLAAQSSVSASWSDPKTTMETNIIGTLNILEAIRKINPDTIVQICGSSEEYGLVKPDEIPIKETNPLRPNSPYGVSKMGADLLSVQYHQNFGLNIVVTRAFNHIGARSEEFYVCSDFSKQIALIEKGKQNELKHGNLEVIRDFIDVRDVVRAYYLSVTNSKCIGKQFNICNAKGYKISEILTVLKGLSTTKIKSVFDPSRRRPSDCPVLIGSYDFFNSLTGWKPEIPIEKALMDLLDFWRSKI